MLALISPLPFAYILCVHLYSYCTFFFPRSRITRARSCRNNRYQTPSHQLSLVVSSELDVGEGNLESFSLSLVEALAMIVDK